MAGGVVVELLILTLAGLIVFIRWRYTLAEAISFAIITVLMALSLFLQTAFLLGIPWLACGLELLLVAVAMIKIARERSELGRILKSLAGFVRGYPYLMLFIVAAGCYLMLQAFLIPPASSHWRSLSQILLLQHLDWGGAPLHDPALLEPFGPLNAAVLPYLLLRFQTDIGCGVFGFLAYLAIGSTTYTLSRRYSWPPTALTVSVVVMSMPRLVYHAASPGVELVPAAAALFCILALFRALEQPNIRDLLLLLLGIFFTTAGGPMCLVLPLILFVLGCVKLVRRHGIVTWSALIKAHRLLAVLAFFPAVIFSQAWLIVRNVRRTGEWIGVVEWGGFAYNDDGLYGSVANLLRYLLESADFLAPFDWLGQRLLGISPPQILESLARVVIFPAFGERGAGAPFDIHWIAHEALSWFGPLAFLLVLPAVGYAMIRGPRRLKTTAVALAGYFYLITLIPAWLPGNAHYFTFFYVCGGFCVAFMLPPWRFTRFQKKGLQALAVLMLGFALWGNTFRPVVFLRAQEDASLPRAVTIVEGEGQVSWPNVWAGSKWGRDRLFEARRLFGDDRVSVITEQLTPGAKVGLILSDSDWCYPFMLANPTAVFVGFERAGETAAQGAKSLGLDYLLYLDRNPLVSSEGLGGRRLWVSDPQAHIQGFLIEIIDSERGKTYSIRVNHRRASLLSMSDRVALYKIVTRFYWPITLSRRARAFSLPTSCTNVPKRGPRSWPNTTS